MTGDELKKLRKSSNTTQQALAFKLGVSLRSIHHWETGFHKIKEKHVSRIRKYLKGE